MNGYVLLSIAIAAEVVATSSLKASEGFSRPLPSVLTVLFYAVSFYCLSLTLKSIPVGVAYAIWSALGIVLISIVGYLLFGQKIDGAGLFGMVLIIAGVLMLSLVSKTAH